MRCCASVWLGDPVAFVRTQSREGWKGWQIFITGYLVEQASHCLVCMD